MSSVATASIPQPKTLPAKPRWWPRIKTKRATCEFCGQSVRLSIDGVFVTHDTGAKPFPLCDGWALGGYPKR